MSGSILLEYGSLSDTAAATALRRSRILFLIMVLAFVPLHFIDGREYWIGLVSVAFFASGTALAGFAMYRLRNRQAAVLGGLNAVTLAAALGYLLFLTNFLHKVGELLR
jgi:hypothetical protein